MSMSPERLAFIRRNADRFNSANAPNLLVKVARQHREALLAHIDTLAAQLEDARRLALPAFTSPEGDLSTFTHVLEYCDHENRVTTSGLDGLPLWTFCDDCGMKTVETVARPSAYDMPVGTYIFARDYEGVAGSWIRDSAHPGGWMDETTGKGGIQSGWIEGLFTEGLVTEWRLP